MQYENCGLCPKSCGVDRRQGQLGVCRMSSNVRLASAVLHKGEEPPLLGAHGSGAVFFTGCTLGCPFCQNVQISLESMGGCMSEGALADLFLELQTRGAANINLVTATQFIPSVIIAAKEARKQGLNIPVMWNTSGYESVASLKLLEQTVDIWLPDLKTLSPELAGRLFGAPDYPAIAADALLAMAGFVDARGGMLIEGDEMKRGMIVRHLVMPGELEASRGVFQWYARHLKDRAMLSVMVQYTPVNATGGGQPDSDYIMPDSEYDQLMLWLDEFGIEEGFLQAPEAADKEWIPDFNRINPFPETYSTPVWHWKKDIIPE